MTGNLSASILARLLTLAKQRGDDYNLLLNRYGMERLLARVSTSPHADRFLLKGALLFALWYDTPHRPTRDADLLGFGRDDEANLIATFRDIAAMEDAPKSRAEEEAGCASVRESRRTASAGLPRSRSARAASRSAWAASGDGGEWAMTRAASSSALPNSFSSK